MTASMVAKYCAMEEMNGRVNPALSDSDEDSNSGRPSGPGVTVGPLSQIAPSTTPKSASRQTKPSSDDEHETKRPIKSVKQYQTQL